MQTAIITGGGVRIGRAISIQLAKAGYNIALHYNQSKSSAQETAKVIEGEGVQCKLYACDLFNLSAVSALIGNITCDFDDISLLVNSASIFLPGNIELTEHSDLIKTLHINLVAPFLLMKSYKQKVNRGQIINILDQRISGNVPSYSAYTISKSGFAHLTTLASVEFGSSVRVNGIAPGLILPSVHNDDEDYFKRQGNRIPMQKVGNVESILTAIEYLIANHFVNGDILYVDGGESKSNATIR